MLLLYRQHGKLRVVRRPADQPRVPLSEGNLGVPYSQLTPAEKEELFRETQQKTEAPSCHGELELPR